MIIYDPVPKTPLADLTTDLEFELPDLAGGAALHFLRRAARRMAKDGDLARRTASIYLQSGVYNYRLDSPDEGVTVNAVLRVTDRQGRDVPRGNRSTSKTLSWMIGPNEIGVHQAVMCPDQLLTVVFSVVPTNDACEIDDTLAVDFYETLLDGARALAFDAAGKPWSDPNRAAEYRRRFLDGLSAAKVEQLTGRQRGPFRADWGAVV